MLDASVFSALAAIFSAICSFMLMRIHHKNLTESVRPELVLTGWSHSASEPSVDAQETVEVANIRNVGRGLALDVLAVLEGPKSNPMAQARNVDFAGWHHYVIAPGESVNTNCEFEIFWKNIRADATGMKEKLLKLVIYCWDSRGARYETTYFLRVWPLSMRIESARMVGRNLQLFSRKTTMHEEWQLKFLARFKRVPLLGRCLRNIRLGPSEDWSW
jgi:hypothetical protein